MTAAETPTYLDLSKMIDHSLLNPTLTIEALESGIAVARAYNSGSVCIMPFALERCAELLRGTVARIHHQGQHHDRVSAWWPHDSHQGRRGSPSDRRRRRGIGHGCEHLPSTYRRVGLCRGRYRSRGEGYTRGWAKVKVIFENCYLNAEQKIWLCEICNRAGADWVKVSTGYSTSG